ncbi:SDR family oxidoreductase [Immundisolibacter sp.]|uniref:SDR family NAD(P)-dependent oxidoreductase n=1 Tax=Immundisolibacter sp. TaxID=1934948 RepID=UPI0026186F61|nr:SDR family oxidoreductase [Immundisolibacter sp.]MDD3651176.1 SDR family oxidoreductase [Immundisolibacter sp.]
MSALLDGRVIIVTGAARGIGQAYAKGLAEAGARVVAADILDCSDTVGLLGGRGTGVPLDVTDMASCMAMADATLKAFGRIDGIINNAAMFGPSAHSEGARMLPFDEIPEDAWRRMLEVNVTGVWHACKAVVPAMRKQGYGKIVNISSNTIQLGNPHLLHYVVSKGAVATMTRCLARELGPAGIRVNTLVPGFIQSQASLDIMRENHAEGITDAMRAICSLGREQYADDLVGTAIYLCSALSDFVSGQMISVDGGACFTGM